MTCKIFIVRTVAHDIIYTFNNIYLFLLLKGAGAEPGSEVAFTLEHQPPPSSTIVQSSSSLALSSSSSSSTSFGVSNENIINSITTTTTSNNNNSNIIINTLTNNETNIISPMKASKLMLLENEVEKVMMLGRVIFYHVDSASYEILDVDDSKNYFLPESQVLY